MRFRTTGFLLLPAVAVIFIFMAIPMLISLTYSFLTANTYGGVTGPLSVGAYIQLLYDQDFDGSLVFMPDYIWIILRSVYLAVFTTILSLAVGFPVAWYIVCQSANRRKVLLTLVTLPFWINTLIRTYCWILILRDEGLINNFLKWTGLITPPATLAVQSGRDPAWAGLHLPAVHGAADLRDARAAGSSAHRSRLRPLREPGAVVPPCRLAAD